MWIPRYSKKRRLCGRFCFIPCYPSQTELIHGVPNIVAWKNAQRNGNVNGWGKEEIECYGLEYSIFQAGGRFRRCGFARRFTPCYIRTHCVCTGAWISSFRAFWGYMDHVHTHIFTYSASRTTVPMSTRIVRATGNETGASGLISEGLIRLASLVTRFILPYISSVSTGTICLISIPLISNLCLTPPTFNSAPIFNSLTVYTSQHTIQCPLDVLKQGNAWGATDLAGRSG